MKIEADIKRVETSYDLATREQHYFLVLSVFGVEQRVACSEADVEEIVRQADAEFEGGDAFRDALEEPVVAPAPPTVERHAPAMFVAPPHQDEEPALEQPVPRAPQPQPRERALRPVVRQESPSDDAGISQG